MTCAARTMCASASRSFGGNIEMSAVKSVSANLADFCCKSAAVLSTAGAGDAAGGVVGACARHAAKVAINDAEATAMPTRPIATALSSMNAGRALQHRRFGAEAANRRFPHLVDARCEDQVRFDWCEQPRSFGELDVELAGAPTGVADHHARGRVGL